MNLWYYIKVEENTKYWEKYTFPKNNSNNFRTKRHYLSPMERLKYFWRTSLSVWAFGVANIFLNMLICYRIKGWKNAMLEVKIRPFSILQFCLVNVFVSTNLLIRWFVCEKKRCGYAQNYASIRLLRPTIRFLRYIR